MIDDCRLMIENCKLQIANWRSAQHRSAIINHQSSIINLQLLAAILVALSAPVSAEDWPTYQHDNRRSGATGERLPLPLRQLWVYRSASPPQTAWAGPAPWDSYAKKVPLVAMRQFDAAFFVTALGDRVCFGSSVDDSVHCLDAATGSEVWSYLTEGPVRFPPTFFDDRLYFGSDDGCAYCVRAADGAQVWKYRPAPDDRQVPSNGKLVSLWPVRTGVLVEGGKACFAASLLPWRESFVCALDANTGSDSGPGCFKATHRGMTMQGALLASQSGLYVPQGRFAPVAFKLTDGALRGRFGEDRQGGVYALLTPEDGLVHGKGVFQGGLRSDTVGMFPGGNHMIVTRDRSYFHTDTQLMAIDRERFIPLASERERLRRRQRGIEKRLKALGDDGDKEKVEKLKSQLAQVKGQIERLSEQIQACYLWKKPCTYPYALILAGDVLFAGGRHEVAAFGTDDGDVLWTGKVTGSAYGLAAANGRLLVSTDQGTIHCLAGAD